MSCLLTLWQTVRAAQACTDCPAPCDTAKGCSDRRGNVATSFCRCACHRSDVLELERKANTRQRCAEMDSDTDEQCIEAEGHGDGHVSASAMVIELGRLSRKQ